MTTEKYHFCILYYNEETNEVESVAVGNIRDKACRPADHGQAACMDPHGRLIVLHLFQGSLKIIPVDTKVIDKLKFKDAFNVRLEDLQVRDIAFLLNADRKPTIAVLHETIGYKMEMKTYVIEADKKLSDGPMVHEVDATSHMLIPVPEPRGGLLIVAAGQIQYCNHRTKRQLAVGSRVSKIVCWDRVDQDGFRFLLGDQKGRLIVLVLQEQSGQVDSLKLEVLGRISTPSSLLYLDAGRVFVGSQYGPNQIVELGSRRWENGQFVRCLESEETFCPLLDLIPVDLDRTGQESLIACSGAFSDGGLAVVRRGVGINLEASFSLTDQHITSIWPVMQDHLLVSTAYSTELLRFDLAEGALEALSSPLVINSSNTLYAGQANGVLFQVLSASVSYKSIQNTAATRKIWMPQNGVSIVAACSLDAYLLLGLSSGFLVLFEFSKNGDLLQKKTLQLPGTCSSLALGLVGSSLIALVGLWESSSVLAIRILVDGATPSTIFQCPLVPRSLCLHGKFAFAALPNGTVYYGQLDDSLLNLVEVQVATVGQRDTTLVPYGDSVMALSDRPCLIVFSPGPQVKPHFLSAGLKDTLLWSPLNTATGQRFVAVNVSNEFSIGSLDAHLSGHQSERLHMAKIPIGETVRRVVNLEERPVLAAISIRPDESSPKLIGLTDVSSLLLLDGQTLEIVDRYALPSLETAQSIIRVGTPEGELLVVGTAIVEEHPKYEEAERGRLLTFRLVDVHETGKKGCRLSLIDSLPTIGAVYSMAWTRERLAACVNGQTVLYHWQSSGNELGWRELFRHHGQVTGVHIDALEDRLSVADMMRSANLLALKPDGSGLSEIARDYYTGWATCIKFIDADRLLMADDHGNLSQLVVQKDPNFVTDRLLLEHATGFHVGSTINAIVRGSLIEPASITDNALFKDAFIFGTACGTLGTIGVLQNPENYTLLAALQANILRVSRAAGFIDHNKWRAFYNEKRSLDHHDHFIDGDVIQRFTLLPPELQRTVVLGGAHGCQRLPQNVTQAAIVSLVDQLSRQ